MSLIIDPNLILNSGTVPQLNRNPQKAKRSTARRIHARGTQRQGNISFVYLVICVLVSLMMVFLVNIGHITHQKLQMQNAADSAAISSSTWLARGMNAVTATNHLMGEMAGIIIVHHSLGGYPLDERRRARRSDYPSHDPNDGPAPPKRRDDANRELDRAADAAEGMEAGIDAYETVRQKKGIHAGLTLLDAKIVLKERLTEIYLTKVAAKVMQESSIPPVVAAGVALEVAMDLYEFIVWKEYLFLKAMDAAAVATLPLKLTLRDQMLPAARDYTEHVVETYPRLAQRAAKWVGRESHVEIELFPRQLKMPVIKDPHRYARAPLHLPRVPAQRRPPPNPSVPANNMREQVVKTSQLARATFPWVVYHRQPVSRVLGNMAPISRAKSYYKHWTDGSSKRLLNEYQRARGLDLGLYVLEGATPPDKGYELWTEDRELLDELFSVQAFAYRTEPIVFGQDKFFTQQHPEGRVAISQALVYNGNRQKKHPFYTPLRYKRVLPERQADVGWDTLNWKEGLRPSELVATTRRGGVIAVFPAVRVNWQTKLVPISPKQLEYAREKLPTPIRNICDRIDLRYPKLLTH